MRKSPVLKHALFASACLLLASGAEAADVESRIAAAVEKAVGAVIKENDVPGMAVGVAVAGQRFVFNYGLADRKKGTPVGDDTLFEIGSVSKTFTATLGGYAEAEGALSFSDAASEHMPELAGSAFDRISLLDLGTYTAGGLPLQFPDDVTDDTGIATYFRGWRPAYEPGTQRVYSNPSIGLFGHLAARSLGQPYADLMHGTLFPALGLENTYIRVPDSEMQNYAFGYNKAGKPVRVNPGALDSQAYGVKTTASDLLRFVEVNMDPSALQTSLQQAIAATQDGYYRIGDTTQSLGWELYAWPAKLDVLLSGNSSDMALKPHAATFLSPPEQPAGEVFVNKTGSTGGFGAYAAFVPTRGVGVVLLANRNYPNAERIKAAYAIFETLEAISGEAGQ
jgi:beta-lactamase class C